MNTGIVQNNIGPKPLIPGIKNRRLINHLFFCAFKFVQLKLSADLPSLVVGIHHKVSVIL